jgi:hypothetical protein
MKKKDLLKMLKDIPDDWEIVLSKFFVLTKEGEYEAILDIPVSAIASNESDKEVRLCIQDSKGLDKAFGKRIDLKPARKSRKSKVP